MVDDAALCLTVDRGNTTLDCMLHGGDAVPERARLAPAPGELAAFLGGRVPDRVAGVTVVDGGLEPVRALCAKLGRPLLQAGVELSCPLELAYPEPHTLGADRWVAAVAAHEPNEVATIVVDCGTAVTVDAVSGAGAFLGGVIAPGAATIAHGLAERAPGLPRPGLDATFGLPAVTSGDAVAAGVQLGFAGLVEGLVARVATAVGFVAPRVVVTGGHAELFARHSRLDHERVPDLVHRGLRCLLSKHGSAS